MKIKNFDFWYRTAKRFSLLLLSSIFLFGGLMHAQNVNMSRYITLNVAKDSLISIRLATDAANTPVRIVSGDSVYDFTTTSTSLTTTTTYYAGANTMTIYGDVKTFYCNDNKTKITGIDLSKNVALCSLSCYNNQLTSLDLSKNTALTYLSCRSNQLTSLDLSKNTALYSLYCNNNNLTTLDVSACTALISLLCYNNKFSTAGYDSLMCSLPSKSVSDNARFYPLYNANDANSAIFLATNATNATAKNWQVLDYDNRNPITTSGNYDCSGVNMSRYITLTMEQGKKIKRQPLIFTNFSFHCSF